MTTKLYATLVGLTGFVLTAFVWPSLWMLPLFAVIGFVGGVVLSRRHRRDRSDG